MKTLIEPLGQQSFLFW